MKVNLTYKNKTLTITDVIINEYDITFDVVTDSDNIFGIIQFNNSLSRTIQFTKYPNITKGRLVLTSQDITNISKPTLQICDCNAIKPYYSNKVDLKLDLPNINMLIKLDTNTELIKLRTKVSELERTLEALSNRQVFKNINCDFSYSRPGMVPVTVDNNGTFVLKKPFANAVNTVNDIIPEGGNIKISSDDIPHKSKMLAEVLEIQSKSLSALLEYVKTLQTEIQSVRETLIDLQLKLNAHISNPII